MGTTKTERQFALSIGFARGFAACAHRNQTRKYTGEPYLNHCQSVAEVASVYTDDEETLVAAYLHDVVEDTDVTEERLVQIFNERVAKLVMEVTNPSRLLPNAKRWERKALDLKHLARCSPQAALIKLADICDNVPGVVKHDPGFAKVYVAEETLQVDALRHGPVELWQRAQSVISLGIDKAREQQP